MRAEGPAATVVHLLAAGVAVLMAVAAATGLLAPTVYRDNELVTAGWRGNDLVTLVVAMPLLLLAIRASVRRSAAGRMLLLGLLLYAFYGYAFYLFGAAFNALFLVYVAIVTAAGWALALGLMGVDAPGLAAGFRATSPARVVALFMLLVSLALGGFWIALSLAFLATGEPPPMVEATAHPTNVTGALDLALVVSLGLLAAHWLWRRQPWGYVLAVIWNVKGAVYMLALSGAAVSAYTAGAAADLTQLALWAPIGVGCVAALVALLAGYEPSPLHDDLPRP